MTHGRRGGNSGNVRTYVTVRIGGITIHGAKIVQQPGQRPWVAIRKVRYTPIVEVTDNLKKRVSEAVLSAWEAR